VKRAGRKVFIPSHNPSPTNSRLQVGPLRTLMGCGGVSAPQEVSVGRLLGYSTSPIFHLEISSGCDSVGVFIPKGLLKFLWLYRILEPRRIPPPSRLSKTCSMWVGI